MATITYTRICLFCNNQFITADKHKKFCNLSCSSKNKNKLEREKKLQSYLHNPKRCLQCNNIINYHSKVNRFCSRSCSATFSNLKRDYSVIKCGPKKGTIPVKYYEQHPRYTKVKQCIICNAYHPKAAKTCSKTCLSKLISNLTKGKLGGNTDPNIEYYDSYNNHCYLDSTWELILANSLDKQGIRWIRPKRFILSDGRGYTPDFFLPDYNVYLDPKALRPKYYRNSKLKVQQFENETGNKCLIITKEKYLHWFHVQTMLLVNTHWS